MISLTSSETCFLTPVEMTQLGRGSENSGGLMEQISQQLIFMQKYTKELPMANKYQSL